MISIEVLKSKNSDQLSETIFYKNIIYIGCGPQEDVLIEDKRVKKNLFFIEVVENKLLIHPHKELDYFLIDGKRTTSVKYIQVNQIIGVYDFEFKINNFIYTDFNDLKTLLNNKTDELIESNSDKIELISQIEELNTNDND